MAEDSPSARVAAQDVPDLTGRTFAEADGLLSLHGFTPIAPKGTYRRWQHGDGSIIHISSRGRVVREGPRIKLPNGSGYSHRFTQHGVKIPFAPGGPNTHDTGEGVILL